MDKNDLLKNVRVLYHSCVRLQGDKVIYVDPYELSQAPHDADIILITHEHYDHFSPADIAKVKGAQTVLVAPESMRQLVLSAGFAAEQVVLVEAGQTLAIAGVELEIIPAYNVGKQFHPQANRWVGYVIALDGVRYYVAGDTDATEDNRQVRCDVALLPVGGTYTMDAQQAAALANQLKPQAAVPIHYGAIVGEKEDGQRFCQLLDAAIASAMLTERCAD